MATLSDESNSLVVFFFNNKKWNIYILTKLGISKVQGVSGRLPIITCSKPKQSEANSKVSYQHTTRLIQTYSRPV